MARNERRGILPLVALLFLLNSAVCYCAGFSHEHSHGGAPEAPAHECECLTATTVLPADQRLELPGLVLLAPIAEPLLGLWDSSRCAPSRDVRPPGDHGPPRHVLHRTWIC